MGLKNWEHITFSYTETVRLPPTNGTFEENMKRVHDLKH
jgi:hypothetical protein